jgi:hypothetical protein
MLEQNITSNIAVYIDGDNASHKDFPFVYEEIKKHGRVIIGRIYGDWTKLEMRGWKEVSINFALESINCFGLSKKNSTDIYLICDILQDLYKNPHIDTYIIVSSDSDYTHVTKRIRSEGKKAIGIGRKNTPLMLKNACDIFIATEVIKNEEDSDDEDMDLEIKQIKLSFVDDKEELQNVIKSFKNNKKIAISRLKRNLCQLCDAKNIYTHDEYKFFDQYLVNKFPNDFRIYENNKTVTMINITDLLESIDNIFDRLDKEDFNLSVIKDTLLLKDPSFDQRSYGFSSMRDFIEKLFPKKYKIINKENTSHIKKII